ncbi:MAG: NADH-quinone oxidoreductase subunit C [Acidimicrobiales bacterium]|jgi:NADH-quinone oxidoreductase subunit C|nr:NADH-quinone oxidoreductase subunit C [Acidimicrobiales bacterium]
MEEEKTGEDASTDAEDDIEVPLAEESLLYEVLTSSSRGQMVLHPTRDQYLDTICQISDDGFAVCIDLTAVDYLENPEREIPSAISPERFEVVVNLLSHTKKERIRLRVQIPESDPVLPTVFDIYPGSEALEREVYDLFGIEFDGHPDLTRILMPENWDGHPLRKDHAVGEIPVQFKDAPGAG